MFKCALQYFSRDLRQTALSRLQQFFSSCINNDLLPDKLAFICLSEILLHNLSQAWLHTTISRTFPFLRKILNICYELQGIQAC